MKVEILFDEMGGFECYCTASSLFLILLFSVCSIRHVCSSEASMADSDPFLCWSRLSGSFTVRSNPALQSRNLVKTCLWYCSRFLPWYSRSWKTSLGILIHVHLSRHVRIHKSWIIFSAEETPKRYVLCFTKMTLFSHTFFFLQMNTLSMESQQYTTVILCVITQLPICDLVSLLQSALWSDFDQMLYLGLRDKVLKCDLAMWSVVSSPLLFYITQPSTQTRPTVVWW